METNKWQYITLIAGRGDHYGGHGGTHDLLNWCGKSNTNDVTEDEARRYWENPREPYEPELKASSDK